MIRKLTILLFACCLAYHAAAQTPVADRNAVLTRIEASLNPQAGKTIKYTFTQTKHSPLLAQDAISHGNVTLTGQRFLRWHYTDPRNHAIVVDGDSIYAVSAGELEADQEVVGTIAADVISEAIIRAVTSAKSAYGCPSAEDLRFS